MHHVPRSPEEAPDRTALVDRNHAVPGRRDDPVYHLGAGDRHAKRGGSGDPGLHVGVGHLSGQVGERRALQRLLRGTRESDGAAAGLFGRAEAGGTG